MTEKEKSLGLKISELIWAHDPRIAVPDPEACAAAATEVAGVLGCLVAVLVGLHVESQDEIIDALMANVERAATSVRWRATLSLVREPGHA